jgi:hypothetical protein
LRRAIAEERELLVWFEKDRGRAYEAVVEEGEGDDVLGVRD